MARFSYTPYGNKKFEVQDISKGWVVAIMDSEQEAKSLTADLNNHKWAFYSVPAGAKPVLYKSAITARKSAKILSEKYQTSVAIVKSVGGYHILHQLGNRRKAGIQKRAGLGTAKRSKGNSRSRPHYLPSKGVSRTRVEATKLHWNKATYEARDTLLEKAGFYAPDSSRFVVVDWEGLPYKVRYNLIWASYKKKPRLEGIPKNPTHFVPPDEEWDTAKVYYHVSKIAPQEYRVTAYDKETNGSWGWTVGSLREARKQITARGLAELVRVKGKAPRGKGGGLGGISKRTSRYVINPTREEKELEKQGWMPADGIPRYTKENAVEAVKYYEEKYGWPHKAVKVGPQYYIWHKPPKTLSGTKTSEGLHHAKILDLWNRGSLELETWFERDRAFVGLKERGTDKFVAEVWDEMVNELVEDGYLDPGDWGGSLARYMDTLGTTLLISKPTQEEPEEEGTEEEDVAGWYGH